MVTIDPSAPLRWGGVQPASFRSERGWTAKPRHQSRDGTPDGGGDVERRHRDSPGGGVASGSWAVAMTHRRPPRTPEREVIGQKDDMQSGLWTWHCRFQRQSSR